MTHAHLVSFAAAAVSLLGCGAAPLEAVSLDPQRLQSGLVAHWTFDEGSGTSVVDHSGNGHDGTLVGGSSWTSMGRFKGALALAANEYVVVSSFPQATESWTVSVWIRSTAAELAANVSDLMTIISAENVFVGGWQMHLDNRPTFTQIDASYFAGGSLNDYVVASCKCIEADRWIHIAAVWDSVPQTLTIYRDGVAMQQQPMPSPILPGDTTLYIGTWQQLGRYFVGEVDDFAIWRRALLPPEIALLLARSVGT